MPKLVIVKIGKRKTTENSFAKISILLMKYVIQNLASRLFVSETLSIVFYMQIQKIA